MGGESYLYNILGRAFFVFGCYCEGLFRVIFWGASACGCGYPAFMCACVFFEWVYRFRWKSCFCVCFLYAVCANYSICTDKTFLVLLSAE